MSEEQEAGGGVSVSRLYSLREKVEGIFAVDGNVNRAGKR